MTPHAPGQARDRTGPETGSLRLATTDDRPQPATVTRTVEVAAVIAQAGRAWASLTDRDTALGAVVELAARVADCDGAGITIRDTDSGAAITAGSNHLARSADQLQALLQQGPGLDQAWPQDIVCTEFAAAQRWPDWAPTAANLGLHSILTVHLYTDRHPLGALTLYSAQSRVYHPEDLATAHLVSAHASAALTRLHTERHLGLASTPATSSARPRAS